MNSQQKVACYRLCRATFNLFKLFLVYTEFWSGELTPHDEIFLNGLFQLKPNRNLYDFLYWIPHHIQKEKRRIYVHTHFKQLQIIHRQLTWDGKLNSHREAHN